ncbi:MAG: hypothetical protein QOH95_1581 [Gaiellaceae bacterium]|nr:hypothetical protein [Gaiellaceae bacterium]
MLGRKLTDQERDLPTGSLRARLAELFASRFATAVVASVLTALVVGGMAVATQSPHRALAQATVVTGQLIDGGVQFVDATETTSFTGIGGSGHTTPGITNSTWTMPIGGTFASFTGQVGLMSPGTFTFTLFVNGAASGVTCTITAPSRICTSAGTAGIPPGALLAIQLQNPTGGYVNNVRWTALFSPT